MGKLRRVIQGVALAALAASGVCSAQVFKCVSPDGKIEFSNIACPSSATKSAVRVAPNSTDMSGSREQTLSVENQQLRERMKAQDDQAELPPSRSDASGLSGSDKSKSVECRNATKKYLISDQPQPHE
jgi:Domain of unknown function (DUF4124)